MDDLDWLIAEMEALVNGWEFSDAYQMRGWSYWQTHRDEIV